MPDVMANMTGQQLEAIGLALYGREWIAAMSHALQLNRRTIERMAADSAAAPPLYPDKREILAQLCEARGIELARILREQ